MKLLTTIFSAFGLLAGLNAQPTQPVPAPNIVQIKTSNVALSTDQIKTILADDDILTTVQRTYRAAIAKAKNNVNDPEVVALRPAYIAALKKRNADIAAIVDTVKPFSSQCAPNQVNHAFKTAELDTSNGQMSILVREGERPCGLGAARTGAAGGPMARPEPLKEPAPRSKGTRTAPK